MTIDWVRDRCLRLPNATEDVKWEHDLVFSIGGKMFAAVHLEPGETWLSFKCSAQDFAALVELPGCRPAPYLARAQWVAMEHPDALENQELERLLKRAYEIVLSRLPKKLQRELAVAGPSTAPETAAPPT
jgi:predicted DNA-binding protein (MmcQ/YjbR family)